MDIFEIIFIGIGLSMDAAAVSISNGIAFPNMERRFKILMPVFFGLFQGLMPLFGYFAGGLFQDFIHKYAGIVTFVILGFIGGKMIYDGIKGEEEEKKDRFNLGVLISQSIATSIDAFAVGVSFVAGGVNIFSAAPVIAVTTFLFSILAMLLGRKLGEMLGSKAQIFGGVVLAFIGIKALF